MALNTAQTDSTIMRESNLAPYMPGRSELAEFASRLKISLSYKGAEKLTDLELLALAAASHAHGLNPYMGEIWAIPGKGLMVGRAGWVKKINEKLDNRGIRWWPQYLEIRAHERETFGVPADARLAYVCELRRQDQIEAYITDLERLNALGIQGEAAIDMLGKPPVIKGVGYIGASEVAPGETFPGTTNKQGYMSFGERCQKRAFAQAVKQIVDLPFNVLAEGDVVEGVVLDGYDDLPAPEAEIAEHWSKDAGTRKRFWRFAKTDMRLSEDEAHEALGAAHLDEYAESEEQAMAVVRAFAAAKYGAA